jgi:hypothetical protein
MEGGVMKIARFARTIVSVVFLLSLARPASAAPVVCWGPITLDVLVSLGSEGCVAGARHFYDFHYEITGSGGAFEVPASAVMVDIGSTRFGQFMNFVGDWVVAPGQSLEGLLSYSFSGMRVNAASVGGTPAEPLPGIIPPLAIEGVLCLGDTFPCDDGALLALPGFTNVTVPVHSRGSIQTFFALDGGSSGQDLAVLTNVFSVPEPSLALLLLAGLGISQTVSRRRARRT